MNRSDFQRLADLRLKEARALLAAGLPNGAFYLAGYAVECALKACIALQTQQHDFPDKKVVDKSYTHDIDKLLDAAGLSGPLKGDIAMNPRLESDWEMVRYWSEQSRYELSDDDPLAGLTIAREMIKAVESEQDGALPWIKQRG
jgi:HEPN domain-containing protein